MEELITEGLMQGLILAFVALGVMIPFRFLNFADLTGEGTYPLGGSLCALCLIQGLPPLWALVVGAVGAGTVGLVTASVHILFKVPSLLVGIVLSMMLYSVNLRLLGKPNVPLFMQRFAFFESSGQSCVFLLLVLAIFLLFLWLFFHTEKGLRLRAVGFNPQFCKKQGIQGSSYLYLGIFLGNMVVGLGGGLVVQLQSYADVGMGMGVVIQALGAFMIGEGLVGNQSIGRLLLAPVVGALIFQQVQGFALWAGLAPSDLKFFIGFAVLFMMIWKSWRASV